MRAREDQVYLVLTLVIGALVGLSVVAFIVVTERLGARLYPPGGAAWHRLLIPVLGSLGMGLLLQRYFPDARGSGVPQTKAALFARDGYISLRTVLGKFFCTSVTLACGLPLGREGPAVQVGGGIASILGRRLGLRPERVKMLIPVGAAAAIAAAFNTPVAAVLFALEEVMGDLHAPLLGSVVLSSATSWMVLRLLLGDEPLFHVPQYQLVHPLEFGIYAVLGLLGGVLSTLFVKLLLRLRAFFLRLPPRTRWVQPVAGGLLVGAIGWFVPQVLGVGYGNVGDALNGSLPLQLMALLVLLKLVIVPVCYSSGNAGGIFAPSLFIGAMFGGTVGSIAHYFLPAHTATPGAYALIGMGALFAGIIRAPMTSVLMIFEITRDYSIIVPVMIANLASFFIARAAQHQPIYEALSMQDGVHLPAHHIREREARFRVHNAISPATEVLPPTLTAAEALARASQDASRSWLVAEYGRLTGVVSMRQLENFAAAGGQQTLGGLLDAAFPHVHPDQSLSLALERMGTAGLDRLPVVHRADVHQLIGVVTLEDVLKVFGITAQRPT